MKAHLVGGGIASLAAAAALIREANVLGTNICVYETGSSLGGAMAMSGGPESGYVLPTGRVFEKEYRCAFELFSQVPSASDPGISILDEITEFNRRFGYDDKVRIIDGDGNAVRSDHFGLSRADRLAMIRLILTPEPRLSGRRIDEFFDEDFFKTEFWTLWTTLLNSLPQHSALEMRRFMCRFLHILPELSTMRTILRTRFNQSEAIVKPIADWLARQGVTFLTGATVTNVEFVPDPGHITANALEYVRDGKAATIEIAPDDIVLVCNGTQIADAAVGSMDRPAKATLSDASWALWRRLAQGRPEFGNPDVFFGKDHVPDTKWLTYTVTTKDPAFFRYITDLTGSEPGRGGLLTLQESNWLITIALFHQPEFRDQPDDTMVWWGFALYPDRRGNFIEKPVSDCTGREILEETLRHFRVDDRRDAIISASTCIPCILPYAGSVWLTRKIGDRPQVVPGNATNFGFIGQFAEVPQDACFTMEYAVRTAREAVATLLKLEKRPPPVYQGHHDPEALYRAMQVFL